MGRTKRAQMTPSTPRTQGTGSHPSIRSYLHTPGDFLSQEEASNMAPSSPSSTLSEEYPRTDSSRQAPQTPDWYTLFTSLPKKEDFQTLLDEVKATLRTEISALGTSLTALETRVQALETQGPNPHCPAIQATEAHSRHIQDLRLHIEDLDNRSRRHNIRVRGCRESDTTEDARATLTPIFNRILGRPRDARIHMDRAHRALRSKPPPARQGTTEAVIRTPQDVLAFQEALNLPRTPISDWTACPLNERLTGRPTQRTIHQGPDRDAPRTHHRLIDPEE
ncbi:Hypothetical predicted protein [Pelobates cultripes]|uniref:Uncharacterized protein n=1 Tax=Pelobates cultripes TaxID=61616 RepID=A0AAD1VXR0_PELCU|nr:Hypothetical predicted protein [Pelobates cultripes]